MLGTNRLVLRFGTLITGPRTFKQCLKRKLAAVKLSQVTNNFSSGKQVIKHQLVESNN